ncbi:MAG: hypothetical protein JXQ79_09360, partial [Rhodobacteraceae bacterium]|nr:hypothetical protein [Paracoccaceae bacterium]
MESTSKQHAGKSPWYERLFGVTFLRSVFALMLREMATTFGRSPGGYVWAIAEPVAAVAMLSIIFSIAFRNPPLGVNFALFYATGVLPFLMYADLSMKVGQSIRYSRPLLSYASVTFIDAILGRLILNTLTAIVVFMIVITGIILAFGLRVDIDVLR